MLITQPRSKQNQNGPSTSLMGPGGAVCGKKPHETVPLKEDLSIDIPFGPC